MSDEQPTAGSGDGGATNAKKSDISGIAGVVVTVSIILIGGAFNEDVGPHIRGFLATWWWAVCAVLLGFIAFLPFLLRKTSGTAKALVITLVATPAIFMGLYGIAFLEVKYRTPIVRTIFGLAATLLPVSMYYLFLVAKRRMIFDQFVTNLRQLGLAPKLDEDTSDEELHARERRANAFLSRFEANYGAVSDETREDAVCAILGHLPDDHEDEEIVGSGDGSVGSIGRVEAQHLFTPSILIPLLLATVLYGLGWLLVLPPWKQASDEAGLLAIMLPDLTPVNFGFLGAYFFSLQTLFFRYVLRDLRPSAYLSVCQRVVLTVIATWVLVAAAAVVSEPTSNVLTAAFEPVKTAVDGVGGEGGAGADADTDTGADADADTAADTVADTDMDTGAATATDTATDTGAATGTPTDPADGLPTYVLVAAFLIGVFPRLLWDYIRSVVSLGSGAERTMRRVIRPDLPLSELDGLNIWHEARLEEEDVSSTPNMATADIVELMLSTRFELHRIIDWVDQAILLTALGPEPFEGRIPGPDTRRGKLRAHGIRTASALLATCEQAEAAGDLEAFESLLGTDPRSEIRSIVAVVERNRSLDLILKWQSAGHLDS